MIKQIFKTLRTPEALFTATLSNTIGGFALLGINMS